MYALASAGTGTSGIFSKRVCSPNGQHRQRTAGVLFAYRADAGHDYKTIEQAGFRKLVLCTEGGGVLIQENSKEKQEEKE